MPGSLSERKAFRYLLLFTFTAHARAGYLYLLSKSWDPEPSTSSTTITEEFLPFIIPLHLGKQPIPVDNHIVKVILFLLYFHVTAGCWGLYAFGMVVLVDLVLVSLWEVWKRGGWRGTVTVWARDPLDLMDPARRNLLDKMVILVAWILFYLWAQLAIVLIIVTINWDVHYLYKDDSRKLSRAESTTNLLESASHKILYTLFGAGTGITMILMTINIGFIALWDLIALDVGVGVNQG